jgi:Rrf2 family iron-sulfur cluster assembly transcriptional regulator
MISKTAAYALRAMAVLQRHATEGPVVGSDIAAEGGIPLPYVGSIMNRLRTARLVRGSRGRGGGYSLRIEARAVNVERIVSVFDDVEVQRVCVLGHTACDSTTGCPVHEMWSDVLTAYDRFLNEMTLERLAAIQQLKEPAKSKRTASSNTSARKRATKKRRLLV